MIAIKSKILSLWDVAPIGVRICCIKFVQRVILVQSRGITDPRVCAPFSTASILTDEYADYWAAHSSWIAQKRAWLRCLLIIPFFHCRHSMLKPRDCWTVF